MHKDSIKLKYPPLTPILASWMQEVLHSYSRINNLFKQYGSPINLHDPGTFTKNYKSFKTLLDKCDLKSTIFFARKANKCRAFIREARRLGCGIDTASYRELKECLEMGCDSEKLVVTAAVKNERLVRMALTHNVLIILDNEDECRLVNSMAADIGKTPSVGIRISGFRYKGEKLYSRFGFDVDQVTEFISLHWSQEFNNLCFDGFHFHLDGYSIEQRTQALLQTLQRVDTLKNQGISTSFIDMGGGFLVNYLTEKKEWINFWNELKEAVREERSPITFGNNGLGYTLIDNILQGSPDVYPYFNEQSKASFLSKILLYQYNGQTIAQLLRDQDIELRMEPGRSLLDQTGMTVAKVAHRKKDQHGNWLVGLQMNRSQLYSSSADFLLDPTLVPIKDAKDEEKPTAVYLTGGFCLEGDIILKRKIVLPKLPEVGDAIAFPNTAGYMMHFYETEAHLFEHANNVTWDPYTSHFIEDVKWAQRL